MKLVTIIPRFGTNVSPIDINEICCALSENKTRIPGAVKLAAERIDSEKLRALDGVILKVAQLIEENDQQRYHRLIELEMRLL